MTHSPEDEPGAGQPDQPYPQYPPYAPAGHPGQAPYQYAPDHPRATTALVLGILGVVLCQLVAPFAWVVGRRTLGEIDAAQGRLGGRGAAQAGYVLGVVGTVLLGVAVLMVVAYALFMAALIGGLSVS